ncbi:MAG: endonuclease III [Nanoarchaeota archaeon]|nr:endonuclease III [Pseudomonadota bacterium]MBU1854158.1 endonuclease III [Nanoarchaeota archaeon]
MDSETAINEFKKIKKYADKTNMRLAAEEWDMPWKILIATIMSAQTRDEVTIKVAMELFKKYPSIKKLGTAKLQDIENMIQSINYYKTKAKNIKNCASEISRHGLSNDFDELIKLPGVGRKTANVYLSELNKIQAIAVDTHVFRISRKMGWAKENTPEKVEIELMNLFPKKMWNEINPTLVRFGKGYSTSRRKEDEILGEIKEKKS